MFLDALVTARADFEAELERHEKSLESAEEEVKRDEHAARTRRPLLAWASSGVRAGDRIVAVNGTAGPAEKLLSLLRRDNKKRRLTLVRPQAEEGLGWRDSVRARRKLFV